MDLAEQNNSFYCIWFSIVAYTCIAVIMFGLCPIILRLLRFFLVFIFLFLPEFSSNQPAIFTQYSLIVRLHVVSFLSDQDSLVSIHDFVDHYVDQCRSNDIHVGWSPIHHMNGIWTSQKGLFIIGDSINLLYNLIIKIHLSSNVSMVQQWSNIACLIWIVEIFWMLHLTIKITVVIP